MPNKPDIGGGGGVRFEVWTLIEVASKYVVVQSLVKGPSGI